jgi:hypothetical protein
LLNLLDTPPLLASVPAIKLSVETKDGAIPTAIQRSRRRARSCIIAARLAARRILIANSSKGRLGEHKANLLAAVLVSRFDPDLYSNLGNKEICAKILAAGRHTDPFLAKTNPPAGARYGRGCNIIRRSRERYATPRKVVEDKISRWIRSS